MTQDVELCDEVIAFDDEIDARYHRIEKLVEELLALETPVATDLRFVLASLHTSIHLERIGDQAVTIAKLTKLASDLAPGVELVEGLQEMGDRCEEMLKIALDSFAQRDVERCPLPPGARRARRPDEPQGRRLGARDDELRWPAGVGDADDRGRALSRARRGQRGRHR